ncbi:MAG: 3-deoxy-7-phosphoheptulonate synthase [Myxococcales bacterium]|nr:3-deoxy-7-phosphoheptulonate synthase [Sorangiineae bacterium PRO1]MCL4748727.1 3-deoxy-7-phosphoheptulonate synthase [Myxococcales bacterium]
MIVTLTEQADVDQVRRELTGLGLWVESTERSERGPVHLIIGRASARVEPEAVARVEGVGCVSQPRSPRPRVDGHGPRLEIGDVVLGGEAPVLIAGPCAVESEEQITRIAKALAGRGVRVLRGGAYKPRTSPYDFQGFGSAALGWLRRAADAAGLGVVSEVMSEREVDEVAAVADLLQVGSRNMQSFSLLKAVGRAKKPVLLKRSMAATVDEWLHAGEYLMVHGAAGVVFCERGIRSFDPSTRNLLDLGSVALLAHVYRLPVVVDPSHAAGRRDLILPLARAALAAGAHGLMIEVHDDPASARSDGAQALAPEALAGLT